MKSGIILSSIFFLVAISATNYTQAYEPNIDQGLFIFVQTTVRNPDGQLVTYLESSKFTDLNLELLGPFLDFEASRGNDPIVTIAEKEYQVIRRVQSKTFERDDLVASTILSNTVDGKARQSQSTGLHHIKLIESNKKRANKILTSPPSLHFHPFPLVCFLILTAYTLCFRALA